MKQAVGGNVKSVVRGLVLLAVMNCVLILTEKDESEWAGLDLGLNLCLTNV